MGTAALVRRLLLTDRRGIRDDELSAIGLKGRLEKTWAQPTGWLGWLMVDDHKIVGKRYIITTFVFLILGGLAAVAMRLQLARPDSLLIGPDLYDQLFTMHGSTMMFLFAVPVMEAFAVYLVPLMVGTRNIAFPRLNAFSYWIYLAGGILLWTAFAFNTGRGQRLVQLRPPGRTGVRSRQACRYLGADDHLHRALCARGVDRNHLHCLQAAGARNDARPHPTVRMGDGRHLFHRPLGDAGGNAVEHDADPRPARRHAFLQSGRGR